MMKSLSSYIINVGQVIGAHGVKGHVKIYSYTRPAQQILSYVPWQLSNENLPWADSEQQQNMQLAEKSVTKKSRKSNAGDKSEDSAAVSNDDNVKIIVKFEDVDDRDSAEALKGMSIYVNVGLLPELEAGDYYWFQLIGLTVRNTEGYEFGKVIDIFDNGANDVFIVRKDAETIGESAESEGEKNKPEEVYLPYDKSFIENIDEENGIITLDWPSEL